MVQRIFTRARQSKCGSGSPASLRLVAAEHVQTCETSLGTVRLATAMPQMLSMNNRALPNNLTLIAGSPFPLKISGLGSDKRHVVLKSSSPLVKIVVVSANDRNLEQTLRLEPASVPTAVTATVEAYLASNLSRRDDKTRGLALKIEPKIDLPEEKTEIGMVTRMLLAEAPNPGDKTFTAEESSGTMQRMLLVMYNRLEFGPQHFKSSKGASVADLIKSPDQVRGFESYPKIVKEQADLIGRIVSIANTSAHQDNLKYRQHVRDAIAVASGGKPAKDPCPTKLYGWRTKDHPMNNPNYVKYETYGGQDFYTLSESFRQDPLQRHKTKK
jgi:hypothetical protein